MFMKKILLLLSAVLVFASCEDFLNETPRHQWEMSSAISNYNSAQQAVNGIYGIVMKGEVIGQELSLCYASRSGMVNTSSMDYSFTSKQSSTNTSLWQMLYQGINACNLAIGQIPNVPDASFPTATAKNELLGEARFLRGYFNSVLLLNYAYWWDESSPYGIIIREEMTTPANAYNPRSTVAESWAKVMEDIDFGIENMSKTFSTPRRVSVIFAKAWKAKLLMVKGDYQTAKTLVDECLAALPAAGIAMQSDMKAHFDQSWDSKENIFVRYLNDDGNRTSNAGYYTQYGMAYYLYDNTFITSSGKDVPHEEAVCGLKYGADWMKADPRFYIVTGKARSAETWDDSKVWTWTKIYRKGAWAGKNESPVDEKYAHYHMRVPELYIMKAELLAHTGASPEAAIAPINEMRAKRTNPVLDPLPTPANTQEMWDFIFQEYCKELLLENGCEYWASLRIKKDGKKYMEHIKGESFEYEAHKISYAIPNSEMVNNHAIEGMQNPDQE